MTSQPTTAPGLLGPPAAHSSITADVVAELVATQLPHLAGQPVGARFDGWDMAVFRLGDELAVRLPRVEAAVRSLHTESHLLGEICGDWTFPFPHVVAHGAPGSGFPWPWTVVSWLPGETADASPLAADAGTDVGSALAQVHRPAPADAPFNVEQSVALAERAEEFEWALDVVAGKEGPRGERLNREVARAMWERALAAPEPGPAVWAHADAHGSNVLSDGGRFAGIIDWGKMAACDRAVDLGFLYTAMPAAGVDAALTAYAEATGHDDAGLRDRARGIGLAKCLSWATLARPINVAMGWRGLGELGVCVR